MKKHLMLGIIVGTAVIAMPVSLNLPSANSAMVTLKQASPRVAFGMAMVKSS